MCDSVDLQFDVEFYEDHRKNVQGNGNDAGRCQTNRSRYTGADVIWSWQTADECGPD